jgi:hypothetical protein
MPMASYYDFVINKYESGMNNLKICHSWVFKKASVNFKKVYWSKERIETKFDKNVDFYFLKNIQTLLLLLVMLIIARKGL